MEIEKVIDFISSYVDYLKSFHTSCRERDIAIQKLEESVFWLQYMLEEPED